MSLLIEWACFRLVMLWPGAWPAHLLEAGDGWHVIFETDE